MGTVCSFLVFLVKKIFAEAKVRHYLIGISEVTAVCSYPFFYKALRQMTKALLRETLATCHPLLNVFLLQL